VRGVMTEGAMAPEIPLEGQRPAVYVFESHVAQKLSELRKAEAEEKTGKEATAAV
jgi:hypothetical protein